MRTKQTTSATYEDYMRLPEGAPYQLIAGQLDLVVEVLSPSTARNDLNPKRRMYESSGVLEYWIVDPATSSIEILTNDAGQFATHDRAATSGLVHSKVLRGFTIDVADVFR